MYDQSQLTRDFDRLRGSTVRALAGRLRARGMSFDPADLEDFYNEAWHALYVALGRGEAVANPEGFLAQVAFYRAVDEHRRLHPELRADSGEGTPAVDTDVDGRLDAARMIRAFTEGIRGTLNERESQAAVLCYLHGMSRPEAAQALGLAEPRMQKVMDGVSAKLGPVVDALRRGTWCETRDSLITAYALGVLDPDGERYLLATSHLDECAACRRRVLGLRGIAAVSPPVAVAWAGSPLAQTGAAASSGAGAPTRSNGLAAAAATSGAAVAGSRRATRTAAAAVGVALAALAVAVGLAAGVFRHDGDDRGIAGAAPSSPSARSLAGAGSAPPARRAPARAAQPPVPAVFSHIRRSTLPRAERERRAAAATADPAAAPTTEPAASTTPTGAATSPPATNVGAGASTPSPTTIAADAATPPPLPEAPPAPAATVNKDAGTEFGFEPGP